LKCKNASGTELTFQKKKKIIIKSKIQNPQFSPSPLLQLFVLAELIGNVHKFLKEEISLTASLQENFRKNSFRLKTFHRPLSRQGGE